MDRRRALGAFNEYVADFDPGNPRIALKIAHTLRVAQLCERIAAQIGMASDDVDLAWIMGLLHDIGRFEQVRVYDTFNDAASVDHAAMGAHVLFDGENTAAGAPLIRMFLADPAHDELLRTAIEAHNAFRLSDTIDGRTRVFCQVLRDADKVDILKVNCTCPIEDIYAVTEKEMRDSALSPACVDAFYSHRCLKRSERAYPADIMLGHICFAWEIVYEPSFQAMCEQGHLSRMLSYEWSNPETERQFLQMAKHMRTELGISE